MYKKPRKGEFLEILLRMPQTIFSVREASLVWGEEKELRTAIRLNKYVKQGKLIRLRRGIYAKDKNYNPYELAIKIYTPSYISFETVLTRSGITFQKYDSIFVASYISREIKVEEEKIKYVRLKGYVLTNTIGIKHENGVDIASKERAFLDRIYVSKNYYFDNLGALDWDKVFQILPIYNNKRMEKIVKSYFQDYKKEL
ncbi:MAG: hypothetical protein K9M44_02085 [Candidatus Pacebacteria bacterium]|nr:hypothetical protein [Candidatus Paceibacterota bacterium]